ncbi:MAG: ABC transporter substrate-binding protein [archaeon]|nr:ABC transporter substrate-binding protein [archaeon]
MRKTTVVLSVIIVLLLVALAYTTYMAYTTTLPSTPPKETVTIVDGKGVYVEVGVPVERIVSITSGSTEIICALGGGNRLVGRDSYSTFPPLVLEKPIVAGSSYSPNLEVLLELEPDLVVADAMLSSELRSMIEDAGVPVIVDTPSDPRRLKNLIKNLGLILGEEEKAEEIVDYIESYENLVEERVGNLEANEKPLVYYERGSGLWTSCAAGSVLHEILVDAGGINIAAGASIPYPTLSAEYVADKIPDIIIKTISRSGGEVAAFQNSRDEMLSRSGLSDVKAIKEGRVYVIENMVIMGIRYPVGLLYLAKWFHPSLFEDIDPATIHEQLIQEFFGIGIEGVFAYP